MRDPKRIPKIIKRLEKIWKKLPDLRIGQLIENVFRGNGYYYEDDEYIQILEDFYKH
ncbi:hypothetical protein M0R04_06405 [Candidatus Dojkabacteria bacterium]|jgi:uncharacterized protein YihD (DUF1040 family)|nr:hypothetical protein [Candidatus Dojkabacteria bacterium]